VNDIPTLQDVLERACEKHSSELLTVDDTTLEYGEAWLRAGQLADSLADSGVEPGDTVGLLVSNRIEYIIADLACVRGGFVKVAMNDMLTDEEIRHIVTDSEVSAVIVESEFLETIRTIRSETDTPEHVVGIAPDLPDDVLSFDECLTEGMPILSLWTSNPTISPCSCTPVGPPKAEGCETHPTRVGDESPRTRDRTRDRPYGADAVDDTAPHSAGYAFLAGMLRGHISPSLTGSIRQSSST